MNKKNKLKDLFFKNLWTPEFTYWWLVSLATVFMFDMFWMGQTTFRPMSYFAFYPTLFLSAFFLALPSLFLRKGVFQSVWLLFFDALFIANLMYCRTYFNAIPLTSYGLIGNLADFKASVVDSFKWYFIFLPILTFVAFACYVFKRHGKWRMPSPFLYCGYVVVLALILWIGDAWRGGIMKRMDFMANYAYLSSSITPIYSLGGFLVHDYFKSTEKLKPEDLSEVKEWLSFHNRYSSFSEADSISPAGKIPKNVVLILCESLESWVLEKDIEGKTLTPYLNSLISDSTTLYAPKVVTQVGSGRSIDAQLLLLAGMFPMINSAYAYETTENKFFTLPKALKKEGAKTFLFTCDKPYVWNQALVAKAFGIDSLIYARDFKIDETAGPSRRLSDGSFMKQISEKLDKDDIWNPGEKAFIMAVTYSGHNPFVLPEHLRRLNLNGDYPEVIKNYMITANYTDNSLRYLIEYLKSRPDWEDTMVIITGDHEGLASDRKIALSNPLTRNFVDSQQHTPLIILNSPVPGQYDEEIGQVDVYSTILDLLGFKNYPWKGLGISIFSKNFPKVAVGASGQLVGNEEKVDSTLLTHLREGKKISDLILKFDLLENYPDSITINK